MRLERVDVRRLPGIDEPFSVEGFAPGLTLVLGPNGIGKSSLCRLVRLALWPEREALEGVDATLVFEAQGVHWEAEVALGRVVWRRDGEKSGEAPALPDGRAAGAARFGLFDLTVAADAEEDLGETVRRELAGGFDLAALRRTLPPRRGQKGRKRLREADDAVGGAEAGQRELAALEERLAQLETRREEVHRARATAERLGRRVALARARGKRRRLEETMGSFPESLERLRGDERERLDEIDGELGKLRVRHRAAVEERDRIEKELERAAEGPGEATYRALEKTAATARTARDRLDEASTGEAELEAVRAALEELRGVWPEGEPFPDADAEGWLAENAVPERLGRARRAFAAERAPSTAGGPIGWLAAGLALAAVGLAWSGLAEDGRPGLAVGALGLVLLAVAFRRRSPAETAGGADARAESFEAVANRLGERLGAARAARKRREECERSSRQALVDLRQALAKAGLEPPSTLEEAEARIEQGLRQARENEDRARRRDELRSELEELEEGMERLSAKRRKLLEPLGAGAEDQLDEWLARLDEYKQRSMDLQLARKAEKEAQEALGDGLPAEDEELDPEDLERRRAEAEEKASTYHELVDEIAEIRAELDRGSTGLTEALAERAEAREQLAEEREKALEDVLANALLDHVRERYARESAPPLVRRAAERLAAFTRGRYDLLLDETGLRARDTLTGRVHSLAELSDGTRAQLLLAARWSYLESLEGHSPVPVVLDEALATSDEERFEAVAVALFEVGRDERQVLYLGAREDEIPRWRAAADALGLESPALIDLAAARGRGRAVRDESELRVPARAVPAPEGRSPQEYGALLGVPLPDPFADAGALHLFHVLADRLDVLHLLLDRHRIETVGQWQGLRRRGLSTLDDEAQARALDARCAVARVVIDWWRIGRARPLDESVLRASAALTGRFRDRIISLAGDLDWDASRLLDALTSKTDERAKGFHGSQRDKLKAELEKDGFLSARDPIPLSEVRARAAKAVTEARAAGSIREGELTNLVSRLCETLARGLERRREA